MRHGVFIGLMLFGAIASAVEAADPGANEDVSTPSERDAVVIPNAPSSSNTGGSERAQGPTADSGEVTVKVTLDPPEIPFHRQSLLTVVVESPADLDVTLPNMIDKVAGLAIADVRRKTETLRGGRRRISETHVLDPILIGNYPIKPVQVTWGDGQSITAPAPALRVRDLTPEEKEAVGRFETIAGPITPPGVAARYWKWWAAAGIAVLGALAGFVYWHRHRKRALRIPPPILPWEVAYQRLHELDQRHLPKSGQYEPFYVDLSAILRYYIEDRFLLHAPEQTTPEFLASASTSGILTSEHQQLLAGFLRHCDRVKFAQYLPSIEEMEHSFATVLQFIDDTVPKPVPAEKEAA